MKKKNGVVVILLLAAAVCWGAYKVYGTQTIGADKILAQSKLNGRTFAGKAVEISADEGRITAYFMEEHSVPIAALSFGFDKAGTAYEEKEGTLLLAESTILDGAGDYSRKELRELMKEKGIKIAFDTSRDTIDFSLMYVKKFEKEAIEVLKAVMYQPHFAKEDLDLAKAQLSVAKRQQYENPQFYLNESVRQNFYKDHPYGREAIADEEKLDALAGDDIRAYLKKVMGKDNLTVGFAGDVTADEAVRILGEVFGDLKDKSKVQDLPPFEPDFSQAAENVKVDFSGQNFVLMFGHGVGRLDKDFYPFYVADYILGGSGLNSRLNQAVREKEGLTYGIFSYMSHSDAVDLWQVYFSATPDNAEKAIDIAQKEYERFYQNGVTEEELRHAKQALLSSFNLRFSSLANIAGMLKEMQRQKLGIDFLQKRQQMVSDINLFDVNEAIQKRMPKRLDKDGRVRIFQVQGKNR